MIRQLTRSLVLIPLVLAFTAGHACAVSLDVPSPEISTRVALNALVSLTDSHFERLTDIMKVLASTSDFQSGDWEKMKPILSTLKKVHLPGVYCFVKPDGSYYTAEKGKQIKSLADRGYFPHVMRGQPVVGDLVFSKSTGKKASITTVPIICGDTILGALIVSVFLEDFSRYLTKQLDLPDDVYFFAVDDGGRIALHSDVDLILKDREFLHISNAIYAAMKQMLQHEEGIATFEHKGVSRSVIYTTSPLTGWHFGVGVVNR